jgi:hypothetical protein
MLKLWEKTAMGLSLLSLPAKVQLNQRSWLIKVETNPLIQNCIIILLVITILN